MSSQYSPEFNQRQFPRMDSGRKYAVRQFPERPSNISNRNVPEYPERSVREYSSAKEYSTVTLLKDNLPEKQQMKKQSQGRMKGRFHTERLSSMIRTVAVSLGSVTCAVMIYSVMLTIHVEPDVPLANVMSFSVPVHNPDGVTLLATLTSPAGDVKTLEFVNEPYLRFEGLTENTEYILRIVNTETQREIYRKNYVTAAVDPYQVEFNHPSISNGVLSFGLDAVGLERKDFYTITVVDSEGQTVYVADSADPAQSVSVPLGDNPADTYYIRVKVNGTVSQYEVGTDEPLQENITPEEIPSQVIQPEEHSPEETPPEPEAEETSPEEIPVQTTPPAETLPEPEERSPEETPPETEVEETSPEEIPVQTTPPAETSPEPEERSPEETPPETEVEETSPEEIPVQNIPTEETPPENIPPEVTETPVPDVWWYVYDAIEWTWNADNSAATAFIPRNTGGGLTVAATVSATVTEPSCTENGAAVYTAAVTGSDGNRYSDMKTIPLPAMGHDFTVTGETPDEVHYRCTRCGAEIGVHISIEEEP